MKAKTIIKIIIAIVVVLILSSMIMFNVGEKQFVIARQFGKIVSTTTEPGLHFKSPIHSLTYINAGKHLYDIPASEIITSDKKTMVVDAYVIWEVADPIIYIQSLNASEKTAESRIDILVYNAIKTVCSNTSQSELIASRDGTIDVNITDTDLNDVEIAGVDTTSAVKSVNLSDMFLKQLGNQADAYGIKISSINIKILDMPNENKEAVYQRMISERNNISAAYMAQGDSEAKIIRNTTDKEVTITLSEAKAEAEKIVAQGEAEYMNILSAAYNDKSKADFYLFRRSLDAAKHSMSGESKTLFLTQDNPIASIFMGN